MNKTTIFSLDKIKFMNSLDSNGFRYLISVLYNDDTDYYYYTWEQLNDFQRRRINVDLDRALSDSRSDNIRFQNDRLDYNAKHINEYNYGRGNFVECVKEYCKQKYNMRIKN